MKKFLMGAIVCALVIFGAGAWASVTAGHYGVNDPTTEGFTLSGAALGSADGDNWLITDQSTSDYCFYTGPVVASDVAGDWRLNVNVWVTNQDPQNNDQAVFGICDGSHEWYFNLMADGNGHCALYYKYPGEMTAGAQLKTFDHAVGYISFGIEKLVANDYATIYLDGSPIVWHSQDNFPTTSTRSIFFGSNVGMFENSPGHGKGDSHWKEVALAVPEPGSLLVVLSGLTGLAGVIRRRKA